MVKSLLLSGSLALCYSFVYSQARSARQPNTLGIHFIFNDFETARIIRTTSLSAVLKDKKFGRLKDMRQGFALSYGNGLSEHWDFSSMLAGSFLDYPRGNHTPSGSEHLLLEMDASIKAKMLSDKYWFVPYMQIGAGFSKYEGYWGAFIPVGVGLQISFFGEAYLMINSQYRMAVTESSSYHFVHSIGLVGNIGK
ncbi:MAG: hypothetical protein ABI687_07270 [Flavitalea sp.]